MVFRYILFSLAVFSLGLFSSGCDKLSMGKGKPSSTAAQSVQVEEPIKGPLLAQVGSWRIGLDDFNARLDILKQNNAYQDADLDSLSAKKEILTELVRLASLSQEAEKRGLAQEPDVQQALKDYKRTVLIQKLVEDISREINITDKDIEDYYKENPKLFTEPGSIQISEIGLASDSAAKEVQKKLLDGESFSSLARQYSVVATKSSAGVLGNIVFVPDNQGGVRAFKVEEGSTPEEVSRDIAYWQRAVTMQPTDDPAKVVAEDGTVYLIKVTGINESRIVELTQELKEQVRSVLKGQRQKERLDKIAENARQGSEVILNEGLL